MPAVEITTTVEIEVCCDCGEGLCRQSEGGDNLVIVEPCRKCIEFAKDEGYDKGFNDGCYNTERSQAMNEEK